MATKRSLGASALWRFGDGNVFSFSKDCGREVKRKKIFDQIPSMCELPEDLPALILLIAAFHSWLVRQSFISEAWHLTEQFYWFTTTTRLSPCKYERVNAQYSYNSMRVTAAHTSIHGEENLSPASRCGCQKETSLVVQQNEQIPEARHPDPLCHCHVEEVEDIHARVIPMS